MMYNPQLDTFICVVEAGSFSKAAEKLYISAPAVMKQINALENSRISDLMDYLAVMIFIACIGYYGGKLRLKQK